MTHTTQNEECNHCKKPISQRNPSGYCDHLKYPENCATCNDDQHNNEENGSYWPDYKLKQMIEDVRQEAYEEGQRDVMFKSKEFLEYVNKEKTKAYYNGVKEMVEIINKKEKQAVKEFAEDLKKKAHFTTGLVKAEGLGLFARFEGWYIMSKDDVNKALEVYEAK